MTNDTAIPVEGAMDTDEVLRQAQLVLSNATEKITRFLRLVCMLVLMMGIILGVIGFFIYVSDREQAQGACAYPFDFTSTYSLFTDQVRETQFTSAPKYDLEANTIKGFFFNGFGPTDEEPEHHRFQVELSCDSGRGVILAIVYMQAPMGGHVQYVIEPPIPLTGEYCMLQLRTEIPHRYCKGVDSVLDSVSMYM